jgi:tRNA pseudouridine synthase 10
MLGNGRHFVIQFMDPHSFPDLDGESIANLINEQSAGIIRVSEIKVTEDESVMEILKEGEESKTKLYRAVIWIEKSITGEQFAQLPSDPFEIIQETPIRVSHRRSLLPRPRTVHSLKFEQISNHFVIMNIEGGAGMYIKEFVHGDRGRTSPSISEMFSCNADILQLDVVDIQYSS